MPTVDGGRLDQRQRFPPPRPRPSQQQPEQTIRWRESADSSERERLNGAAAQGTRAEGLDASTRLTRRRRPLRKRQTSRVEWPVTAPTSTCSCLDEIMASDTYLNDDVGTSLSFWRRTQQSGNFRSAQVMEAIQNFGSLPIAAPRKGHGTTAQFAARSRSLAADSRDH